MNRIAFLLFQNTRKGSYLHDSEISMLSGRLRSEGVDNDVIETVLHERDEQENTTLIERLADRLADGGYQVCFFHRMWDSDLPDILHAALRARGMTPTFVLRPRGDVPVDAVWDIVIPGLSYVTIRAMGRAQLPLDGRRIPGVRYRDDNGVWIESEATWGMDEHDTDAGHLERFLLPSNFERIHINADAVTRPPHVVIHGNPGCPYRRPLAQAAFWNDVPLDAEVTNTRGCAFCNVNLADDYRMVADIAAHCERQILSVQAQNKDAYEMVLHDQDPFPFLPELFERLIAARARPLHLLIQGRADLFVKRTAQFEAALDLARQGGMMLSPFLVGIENFHQPTLDLYNKGVSVETNVRVLAYLDDVASRYPGVYDRTKVSPGFILWHPWVTVESLRTNLDAVDTAGLTALRSEFVLSKIRLYPDIPMYWKAKQDGLIREAYTDRAFDSAVRYGYPEEHPYRFAQPECQAAYTLMGTLCREHEPVHEVALLRLVLDWLDGKPEYWSEEKLLALRDPNGLLSAFGADHLKDVLALRKRATDGQPSAGRALDAPQERWLAQLVAPEIAALTTADSRKITLFFAASADDAATTRSDPQAALFRLMLSPRSDAPHFVQSARFNLSYQTRSDDPAVLRRILHLCRRIQQRDPGEKKSQTTAP